MNSKPAQLKEKIKLHHLAAKEKFAKKHPHAQSFFQEKGIDLGQIRQHSSKLLAAGTLAGALLLLPPKTQQVNLALPAAIMENIAHPEAYPTDQQRYLAQHLKEIFPKLVCPLTPEQERNITVFVSRLTGIPVRVTLESEHLNTCFGLIGAEQHLPRFPGDTVAWHDGFKKSGITPGRGAWGYFAFSKNELKPEDIQREKYYVAVQTLYLPDWNRRFVYLRDWYKYRKVLVLNPKTGQAVVAVVADAGPAVWTGKQFGGSPEVMYELGFHRGPRKGPVLLFFVDDPENKIPLGPVEYNEGGENV